MRRVILGIFGALALSASAQNNIVSNGGFETYAATLAGWNSSEGYGWAGVTTAAAEGQAYAMLSGNLYQDLPTVPGQVYRLRYAVAGNPYLQAPTLQTFWAGNLVATTFFDTTGHTDQNLGWMYVTNTLLATASTTRLWFANANYPGAPGPYLDVVSAVAVNEPPTACITPPSGIISWWPGRSNALDAVDGNHGALINGAGFADGIAGPAFHFNGSNQCVRIPYTASLAASNYSIETWVQPQGQLSDLATQAVLFAQNNGQCQLLASAGSSGLRVGLQFAVDASTYARIQSSSEIPLGQFSHVAGIWDGTNLRLYINGILDTQNSPGAAPMDSGCPFYIGGIYDPTGGACSNSAGFFTGLIDEVSYYRRALSDNEVHFIYLAGSLGKCAVPRPPSITLQPASRTVYAGKTVTFSVNAAGDAPIGFQWQFNGTNLSGQTSSSLTLGHVQSTNGGNYSVVLNNAAGSAVSADALLTVLPAPPCASIPAGLVSWWRAENDLIDGWDANNGASFPGSFPFGAAVGFVPGKAGQAFNFGTNGVVINDNVSLRLTNGLSIEGWANPTNLSGSTLRTIFSKYDSPNVSLANSSYYLGASNGRLLLKVSSTGANTITLTSPQSLPLGQWTHVAATYDGAALRLYLNGALIAQTAYSAGIFPGTTDAGIGAVPYQQRSWYLPWSGALDEISLYNRALSDSEIAGIYSADLTGKCLSPPIIAVQPQSQAIPLNEDALFSPTVVGSKPFKYQWRFNGTNLAGAAGSRLLLEKVQSNLIGNYSMVVTSSLGRATSSPAALTLLPPPDCVGAPPGLIAWWPANNFANDVAGTNNASLTFVPPPGFSGYATGKVAQSFSFTNTHASVANSPELNFGNTSDFSMELWLKVSPINGVPPFSSAAPQVFIVQKIFTDLHFSGATTGYSLLLDNGRLACQLTAAPFTFTNIPTFTSPGPDLRDGMFHHLAFTVHRSAADGGRLYLDGQLLLTFDPRLVRGSLSNSAPLFIGDTGGGLSAGPNERIDELAIYNRVLSAAEILALRQAGSAGKCIPPPNVLVQPTNQTVNVGNSATLRVVATGFPPLLYQWSKNGTNLAGATNSVLSITNASLPNDGQYALTITNIGGSTTSAVATLAVNRLPAASNVPAATKQNQSISILIEKLLCYASDPDGDPLTLGAVGTASTQGGSVVRGSSSVTYTPPAGFIGADSFTWTISDGRGGSASALVTVQVRSTNEISGNMLPLATVAGGFRVSFVGIPGRSYTVQRAEVVSGPWSTLTSVVVGPDGVGAFDDTNAPPPTAYYRTVYP